MKKLIQGIIDFRQNSLADYRAKYSNLAHGQSPDALLVACCDSRVQPNVFASSDPGDVFVVRNIGNLIPPYVDPNHKNVLQDVSTAAAIDFSLIRLQVKNIIICGHSDCGAMRSFLEKRDEPPMPFLKDWLQYGQASYQRFQNTNPAVNKQQLAPHNFLSQINVLQQLEHLKTYPNIREQLQTKKLRIHGWWFDLATADVYHSTATTNEFTLIDETAANKLLETL